LTLSKRVNKVKLCSFKAGKTGHVGVLLKNDNVADVNYGYAALLKAQGHPKPQQIADVMTPPSMIGLIESGQAGLMAVKKTIDFLQKTPSVQGAEGEQIFYRQDEIKFEAPVPEPSKIFAIAMNNKEAFEIAAKPANPHPLYFVKVPSCVTGPYDPIEIPDIGIVGPEAEVAVIIGRGGKFISEAEASSHIFGYTVHNDITAHELRDTKEWIAIKGPQGDRRLSYAGRYKCFDTFSPMGPWVVTTDEIADPNDLKIEARINGRLVQTGSTADMFFKLPRVISSLSEAHTLKPGDIISWGTVQRPIAGLDFLKIDLRRLGGVLEAEVEGIGCLKNPLRAI
jgi:2-keto-4-pentenoate hydratase/2-oxohepta-3-ene-1,7-dioic acid hydratase in catechol pathway